MPSAAVHDCGGEAPAKKGHDDNRRIDYTYDALAGLHDAMEDGIDVYGYLHWSLLDNYEWGRIRRHSG